MGPRGRGRVYGVALLLALASLVLTAADTSDVMDSVVGPAASSYAL